MKYPKFNCTKTIKFILILCLCVFCFAVDKVFATASSSSLKEHVDILTVLLGLFFSGLVSLITWVLLKISKNQDALFDMHHGLSEEFHELKGAHNALHGGESQGKRS